MGGARLKLPLIFFAATLALLTYWVVGRLPLPRVPAPVSRRTLLYPLEALLQRDLDQARVRLSARSLLNAMLLAGGLGVLIAWPFRNELLLLVAGLALGAVPYQAVRLRIRRQARAVTAAAEPALVLIAKLCEVRNHPFLAICDAMPMLEPPLKAEFERAIAETQAGVPLPEALREVASRCCDNFYLHQLAELVAINIRAGGDLAGSLKRLVARLRTMEELRAEETAELFGYKWLTRMLFGAALLPLPYWALTGSASLQIFLEQPLAQAMLLWVVLSGLAIATMPYWLAIEE